MAPQIPKRHKAAMFKEKGGPLVLEEIDTPEPGYGEVLVKVLNCGVCHSDTFVQQQVFGVPFPLIPGHEIVGDIVAMGPGEKTWKVGERVGGGWHGGHDGTCKQCRIGLNQTCPSRTVNGIMRNGGYAEYCLLRTEAVVPVSPEIDPAAAAPLLCAGVTVFNAMRHQQIFPGAIVAIQGLGGLGHLALQYAKKMGFRVVALGSSGAKEKFARDLGASEFIDGSKEKFSEGLQKLGGAAMIVSTATGGGKDNISELLQGLEPLGKLILLSPVPDAQIDIATMIAGGLSVHSWPSGQTLDCEEAIDFARRQDVNCMIEKFPLDKANEAYEHMLSGKARFRSVLVM